MDRIPMDLTPILLSILVVITTVLSEKSQGGTRASYRMGDRRVFGSAVVDREAQWRRGPCQRSGENRSYSFLCPPGTGGWHTMLVAEAEAKMGVGSNSEEVK